MRKTNSGSYKTPGSCEFSLWDFLTVAVSLRKTHTKSPHGHMHLDTARKTKFKQHVRLHLQSIHQFSRKTCRPYIKNLNFSLKFHQNKLGRKERPLYCGIKKKVLQVIHKGMKSHTDRKMNQFSPCLTTTATNGSWNCWLSIWVLTSMPDSQHP